MASRRSKFSVAIKWPRRRGDRILWQARPLYAAHGGALDRLRLVWLEGRIAAGRGRYGRAERSFRQVRDAFLAHKLYYTPAVEAHMALLLLTEAAHQACLTIAILKSAAADLAKIQK